MKRFISMLSLTALITFNSGCESKTFSMPSLGLPSLQMPTLNIPALDINHNTVDQNLPKVTKVKFKNSLSEVALEWHPIKNRQIVGYRIYRNTKEGELTLLKVINDPYASHYTDKNLNQNILNRYAIAAYTNDGRVSTATEIRITPSKKKLLAPILVSALSNLPNRVKLLWRIHPDPRVDAYVIQRAGMHDKTWHNLETVKKRLSVEFIDYTAKPGIPYNYRIIAQTIDGLFSIPSAKLNAHAKLLPSVITGLRATTNLARKIEIIWKPSAQSDAVLYHVYASDFADGVYSLIGKTKSTHYIDRFDIDGAVRFYKVSVSDIDGLESPLSMKPIRGSSIGYLNAPKITSARVVNNTVELKWLQTDPRTVSYTIVKRYWDGWRSKKTVFEDFKGNTFLDKKIKPSITYTYTVIAKDKDKVPSAASRAVNFSIQNEQAAEDDSWLGSSWF